MHSTPDRAQTTKQCLTCGADFVCPRNRPGKKFCSDSCRNKHCNLVGSPHEYTCEQCGKVYRAKRKDRTRFCSRECSYAWLAANGRPEQRKPQPTPKPIPTCEVCGKPCKYVYAKTCSPECHAERAWQITRRSDETKFNGTATPRACKSCGNIFTPEYGTKRRVFCSKQCQKSYGQRVGKAARRARLRMVEVEQIDPLAVLRRDKWTCHICGRKTPKLLRGTTSPLAPEVDHIIPLALGGDHTWDNVACACRQCNIKKGASLFGQLPLLE